MRQQFDSHFRFTHDTSLVSYVCKKNRCVLLLSTMHHSVGEFSGEQMKPEIVTFYNSTKAGVDTVDQMIKDVSVKRGTRRWPMGVYFNLVNIAAHNAYILWCESGRKESRREFIRNLILELRDEYVLRRQKTELTVSVKTRQLKSPSVPDDRKRRSCAVCPTGERNRTIFICSICHNPACKDHSDRKIVCEKCKHE